MFVFLLNESFRDKGPIASFFKWRQSCGSYQKTKISARVEDRSTHDKIKDAAATYAGRFFVMLSDVILDKKLFHELHNSDEHFFLVTVATLQDCVHFLSYGGTGMV